MAVWWIQLKFCGVYQGSSSFTGTQLHFTTFSSMRLLKSLLSFSDSQPLFSALFSPRVLSFSIHSFQTQMPWKQKCSQMSGSFLSLFLDSLESWPLKSLLPWEPFNVTKICLFMCWSAIIVVLSGMVSLKQVSPPLTEAEIALDSWKITLAIVWRVKRG